MYKVKMAGATLLLGLTGSLAAATLSTGFVPHTPEDKGIRTVEFGPREPCSTCGAARPITIVTPEGIRWYITEPGSVQEMGLRYCPQNESCKVEYN